MYTYRFFDQNWNYGFSGNVIGLAIKWAGTLPLKRQCDQKEFVDKMTRKTIQNYKFLSGVLVLSYHQHLTLRHTAWSN